MDTVTVPPGKGEQADDLTTFSPPKEEDSIIRVSAARTIALALGVALLGLAIAWPAGGVSAQTRGPTLGLDADPSGNTATTLGDIDSCVSVELEDTFQVDIFIKDVDDLIAWEAYLFFDSTLLNVTDRDVQQFQASSPNSAVFDTSESVPDDDGRYRVGSADIADPLAPDSGSGVLATLTLEALADGITPLSISLHETGIKGYFIGPTLTAVDGSHPEDTDNDGYFDGEIVDAQIAIGQPCPGAADSGGESLASEDDGGGIGTALWIIIAAAGVIAAGIVAGVIILRVRHRTASGRATDPGPDPTSEASVHHD